MAGHLPTYQASLLSSTFGDKMLPVGANPGLVFERYLRIWKGLEPAGEPSRGGARPITSGQNPPKLRGERLKDTPLRDCLVAFVADYGAAKTQLQPGLTAYHARLDRLQRQDQAHLASEAFRLTSRLAIGTGNAHPLENSLSFDPLYGVPLVSGSAVKGLCRAQAEALGFTESGLEELFGDTGPEGLDASLSAGALIFYDALPEQVPALELEILNSHHADYYSLGGRLEKPPLEPVDYERPIPVYFLSVAAGSVYRFRVGSRQPDRALLKVGIELLRLALDGLGLGSKTGSGAGRWTAVNPRVQEVAIGNRQDDATLKSSGVGLHPVLRFEAMIGSTAARMMRLEAEAALAPLPAGQDFHLSLLNEPSASDVELYERAGDAKLQLFMQSVHQALRSMEFKTLHVFGIGPIPLLMVLGRELGDKLPIQLYQRHRDTNDWRWKEDGPEKLGIVWEAPPGNPREKHVAVLLNISGEIDRRAVRDAIRRHPTASREDLDLYVLKAAHPDVNIVRRKEQVEEYRAALRSLITHIQKQHGSDVCVNLFPALPLPFAIETGRQLIQSDPILYVYERRQALDGFAYALELTGKVQSSSDDVVNGGTMLKQLTNQQVGTLRKTLKVVLTESRQMRMLWKDSGLDETKIHWELAAENVLQEILSEANKVPANLRKFLEIVRDEFGANEAISNALAIALEALGSMEGASSPAAPTLLSSKSGIVPSQKTILILTASPQGEVPLTLGFELRDIQQAMNNGTVGQSYRLEKLAAARKSELRDGLLRYKPALLHLSGHGVGKEGLMLQDDAGDVELVSIQMLADQAYLSREFLECVVLNACESLQAGEAMRRHVPFVIVTKENIGDEAAVEFSRGFYGALFHGEPYGKAFDHGVARVRDTFPEDADKYERLTR